MPASPVVLVTGASTGIGRATTLYLAARGFQVLAGVRKPEDGEALCAEAPGAVNAVLLDVTNADHVAALTPLLEEHAPDGLAGLVNNAGVAVAGPLELLPLDDLRWQFEVNVFGLVAVTQAAMPALRAAQGRVVNIGSNGSRVTAPYLGAYTASKHSLVAVNDALRQELAPWGMHVSIVEPGAIATPIWDKGRAEAARQAATDHPQRDALYPGLVDKMAGIVERQARRGIPPERVAAAVLHALTARRPKARYPVGTDAVLSTLLAMYLPNRWMDRLIALAR